MRRSHQPRYIGGSGVVLDSATTAWIAAVTGGGGTVSAGRRTLVNTLVTGLKLDGTWTLLDRLWLLAGENTQSALIDIRTASTATATLAPTFTVDRGYTFNGTTNFINTGYNASLGPALTVNSVHLGCYVTNVRVLTTGQSVPIGTSGGGNYLIIQFNGATSSAWVGSNVPQGTSTSNAHGHHIGLRIGSVDTDTRYYYNGANTSVSTGGFAFPISTAAVFIGGFNDGVGVVTQPITDRVGVVHFGSTMTPAQVASFSTRINAYMTAIGANTY